MNINEFEQNGMVRVGSGRRRLAGGTDYVIYLTDGVDGFGLQTERYAVVRIEGDRVVQSIPIKTREERVDGVRNRSGGDFAYCTLAKQSEIDVAVAELTGAAS